MRSEILSSIEFKEPTIETQYQDVGFVTVPLLDQSACEFLKAECKNAMSGSTPGFFSTVLQSPKKRAVAHKTISSCLQPALRAVLGDFRIVLTSFVARSPGSGRDDLPLHQDWSFVDEDKASSMGVWIALQSVDTENGCLQVVPGSHLHNQPLRAIGAGFRYASVEDHLRKSCLFDISLDEGHAVFFNHRLIHGSHANNSQTDRAAVGAVLLPENEPIHLGIRQAGRVEFADQSDSFLLNEDLHGLAARRIKQTATA